MMLTWTIMGKSNFRSSKTNPLLAFILRKVFYQLVCLITKPENRNWLVNMLISWYKTSHKQFPADNQSNSKTYGVLYLKSKLDFEVEKEFNLDICASNVNPISPNGNMDQMDQSEPCVKVKITVKDVNEPPVFSKEVFEARGKSINLTTIQNNFNFSRWKFTNRNSYLYWPIGMSCDCKRSRRWWVCFATYW